MKTMERDLLMKFLRCETSPAQESLINDWLDEDAEHRRELDAMQLTMESVALRRAELGELLVPGRAGVRSLRGTLWRVAAAAAVVAVAATGGFWAASHRLSALEERFTAIEIPAGNRISITLDDGTTVWLNGGSRLRYPVVFSDRERVVRVEGEALFDVAHDAERPFTVRTFACDIDVLGTRFNVQAEEGAGLFSVALLRGSVALRGESAGDGQTMAAGDMARLEGGRLNVYANRERIEDETLWVEGVINLRGYDFATLTHRFERAFDVEIVNNCRRIDPSVRYERGKLWVSEGVEHALDMLRELYPFDYVRNSETNVITLTDREY